MTIPARPGTIRFQVKPGIIDIASVQMLQMNTDLIYVSIDCRQKYPDYQGFSGDRRTVYVGATKDTLGVTKPYVDSTEVRIVGLPRGEWRHLVEVGRYYVNVAFVRVTKRGRKRLAKYEWVPPEVT